MLYVIGVLALYNLLVSAAAIVAVGFMMRDKRKVANMPTAFFLIYVVINGMAVLCKRLGQGFEFGLMMTSTVFAPAPANNGPLSATEVTAAAATTAAVNSLLANVPRKRASFPVNN